MIADSIQSAPIAQPEANTRKPRHVFTTENARMFAARSAIARLKRKQEREIGAEVIPLLPDERYRLLTLHRVRKQLDQLFRDVEKATESSKDKITSAISRLVDVERRLVNASIDSNAGSKSRQKPPEAV